MSKRICLLTLLIMFFQSSLFYSQWKNVSEGLPPVIYGANALGGVPGCTIVSIKYFIDENGALPDAFNLFKTTDNGESWIEIIPPFKENYEEAMDISVLDSYNYWIATDEGRILATNDGGENWTVQFENPDATRFMNYIEMFDVNNGIAMGDVLNDDDWNNSPGPALILRTTDGGNNWTSANETPFGGISGDIWRRIDFVDADNGYFYHSGYGTNKMHKTTDCCSTWNDVYVGTGITALKFFDANNGMFLMNNGSGKRTTDGGNSWENIPFNFNNGWGNDLEYIGGTNYKVWALTQHNIYFSSDFGDSWKEYPFNEELWFYDIHFVDENIGWLLAGDGVYFTNNNGNITSVEVEEESPSEYRLFQNYPNPFSKSLLGNPTTNISYQIPATSYVEMKVYNALGKEIAVLVDEEKSAGKYTLNFNASNLPSGVYFYVLRTDNYSVAKKMILLR